jgi:hypothetical protein
VLKKLHRHWIIEHFWIKNILALEKKIGKQTNQIQVLCHLLSNSTTNIISPVASEAVKVILLRESRKKDEPENMRPTRIIPSFSKVYEKLYVLDWLSVYWVTKPSLILKFGFKKGLSKRCESFKLADYNNPSFELRLVPTAFILDQNKALDNRHQ